MNSTNRFDELLADAIEALEALGFGTDDEINGADCVDMVAVLYSRLLRERAARIADDG